MSDMTIAWSIIALLAAAGVAGIVWLTVKLRAKKKAEKHLGRIGRNYIDLRTPS